MTPTQRAAAVLAVLATVMAVTRLHHFAAVPDASWAVFFLAGFHLHGRINWAFPALMALAVLVDALVIQAQGLSFWQHYCVSAAYWCLIPAYGVLWLGGAWLKRHAGPALSWRHLGPLALAVAGSVALCHAIAQGSFYWISDAVAAPTLAGWWKNYSDWLPAYLGTTAAYVAGATMLHALVSRLGPGAAARHGDVTG